MKKSDYEALARAIKENKAVIQIFDLKPLPILPLKSFTNALCDILAADNPKFNREKFLELMK